MPLGSRGKGDDEEAAFSIPRSYGRIEVEEAPEWGRWCSRDRRWTRGRKRREEGQGGGGGTRHGRVTEDIEGVRRRVVE